MKKLYGRSHRDIFSLALLLFVLLPVSGCAVRAPSGPVVPSPVPELVFYDWADDLPQSVVDGFTKETGIRVRYETYDSTEEAVQNIQDGKSYDLVVIENEYLPGLIQKDRLASINRRRVDNLKNISPEFLNLASDPGNRYSVPYTWGTTGIVVRTDLTTSKIEHWKDLWNPALTGKVGIRETPRDVLGMSMLSLGYSVNTEQPAQLEKALDNLRTAREEFRLVDDNSAKAVQLLKTGEITVMVGWAADVIAAREEGIPVDFILPEEGALFWGDSYTIPASSANREAAEKFLNYLLRPEVSAAITNEIGYPTANGAAMPYVDKNLLSDSVVFPQSSEEIVAKAGMILALSPESENLYNDAWARFMASLSGQ